jgi:hypothetical protein
MSVEDSELLPQMQPSPEMMEYSALKEPKIKARKRASQLRASEEPHPTGASNLFG